MSIAHIITTINRGGAENQLSQMIFEQKKYEKNISVIFLKGNGYWKKYLESNNVLCIGPLFPQGNYLSLFCLLQLLRIILKNKFNILHLHMPPSLVVIFIVRIFFRQYTPAIIYTAHNDEPFFRNIYFEKFLTPKLFVIVDNVIAISKTVKKFLIENYLLKKNKISIVKYGFNKKFYSAEKYNKEELSYINSNNIYIGTVARLVHQKRLDLLIDSFSRIHEKYLDKLRLVIIGDGILKDKLIDFSKIKGVYKKIIWINYTENVITHIKNWDLFCLTSQYEGFGLVLLEAIFSETPVLAMNTSSIKEIIGPCGETVKFGDVSAFSEKIIKIINNKEIYLHKTYLNNYSFKNNILLHNQIYSKYI